MNVCIVGCGGISKCHLSAIDSLKDEGAVLVAAADIIPERAQSVAESFGCKAYTDYLQMLDNEKIDVLHICTPHYLHTEMAVEALKRNINIVLEKPCAASKEDLVKLFEAQKASKAKSAVCFQNRYNSSVVFLKKLLQSGEYGKINGARAILAWKRDADYYAKDAWRGTIKEECGGVLINQAIHTHDLMTYLLDKPTKTIDAKVSNFHLKNEIEVEDTASVYFTFTDGTRAVYYATTACPWNCAPMIDIECEKGILRLEGNAVYKVDADEAVILYSKKSTSPIVGKKEWGNSHYKLIKDFYSCIKSGEQFSIDVFEAGRAVAELLGAYSSSETGQTVDIKDFYI